MLPNIPDRAEMQRLGLKKWRLPNTEIDFVLIEDGPRAGDWLVSSETVNRLPEFYRRVRHLPPNSEVTRTFHRAQSGRSIPAPPTPVYDAFRSSPLGLGFIVPPRWLLGPADLGEDAAARPGALAMARARNRLRASARC